MKISAWILTLLPLLLGMGAHGEGGAPDTPFMQEFHEAHPLGSDEANDVGALAVDVHGTVWASTRAGAFLLRPSEKNWLPFKTDGGVGPSFDVAADSEGNVWIGSWDGLYRVGPIPRLVSTKIAGIESPVSGIVPVAGGGLVAFGPTGVWMVDAQGKAKAAAGINVGIRAACFSPTGLYVATGQHLGVCSELDQPKVRVDFVFDIRNDRSSPSIHTLAAHPSNGRLWTGGMGGLAVFNNGVLESTFSPGSGLPNSEIRALAFAPNGRLWIGTALGVVRLDPPPPHAVTGGEWSLRHGRRWLLDDDVRDIAFGPDGAAWIATGGGVSVIHTAPMTLAKKAAHFLEACHARHIREPGLVEKCELATPGDLTTHKPRDDDNDGQYTCMYLAMESYRYAVTREPEARDRARRAFHALRFLQTVTGTKGFVARTVVPSTWTRMADPNEEIGDPEWAAHLVDDPRAKRVENRWRRSGDGKWLWKGDTSSDEITGHFYGYLLYYDLAADKQERRAVAEHVARVMDHIIDGGYVLRDLDGEHTRWGVWAPERLNHDPLWSPERGINSVEILSYLKTSWHITGNERYKKEYFRLAREEGYAENTRTAKTINPSVRTHIDDELLALAWPGLFLAMGDTDLIEVYREGFEVWRNETRIENSPFFNFTHAAIAGTNDSTLEDSLFFLRDAPLDLVRWTMDNSRREDLKISRLPEYEHIQTSRLPPPSERGIIRWDENPWRAVQGDGGRTESDGVYWLLPYWMGRYHKFIQAPESNSPGG